MEFTQTNAVGALVVLLALLIGGTITSPMGTTLSLMISAGLLIFGVLVFLIGVKHGEYRATH
ncbi:DUF7333 family protein [Halocatena halophila]|uniref:DUF7333 family protein n=1 Tax=Halocatena halophila TaxID=2814576 RepID=UPI002ED1E56E